jgi:hypothetical protein
MDSFVKIIERKQTQQGLTFVNAKKDKVHRNIKRIEHRTVQALGKTDGIFMHELHEKEAVQSSDK